MKFDIGRSKIAMYGKYVNREVYRIKGGIKFKTRNEIVLLSKNDIVSKKESIRCYGKKKTLLTFNVKCESQKKFMEGL